MPSSQSTGDSFYLTNGKDTPPIIHSLLEPYSRIWQYVVVDPSTNHGVIIDPICTPSDARESSPNKSSEEIIRLVASRGYLIDHIFETQSSPGPRLTAAWTLRMHFSHTQGYAPQLCSNGSVSALQRSFARKYGASNGFSTTLGSEHGDKETFTVGRMRVTVMHVPGVDTPNRRAYLIDGAIFGAHSLALPSRESAGLQSGVIDPGLYAAKIDDQRRVLWKSMNRILALSPETWVFYEEHNDDDGAEIMCSTTIEQCRAFNPYIGLNDNEFIIRRRGELRERQDAMLAASSQKKKRFRSGDGSK